MATEQIIAAERRCPINRL